MYNIYVDVLYVEVTTVVVILIIIVITIIMVAKVFSVTQGISIITTVYRCVPPLLN